ncbi:MAG: cyclodeaminase/cyclohydrolase family protein [Sporomusaceae bacterium]|nr:cyclodeaminase/cyclohydrolase family protein [Sporomusaceae bacterium]
MLIEQTITAFLQALQSDSPAPGGGSAAALTGATGAALAIMVGKLTLANEKYEPVHDECGKLAAALSACLDKLTLYIDADTAAFSQVMAAYKLPKATTDEKAARTAAVQTALKQAAALPLAVAQTCVEVLELAARMLAIGNTNAASDAAVAGRLAEAAMWSAIYNVRINLASIKDVSFIDATTAAVAREIDRAETLMRQFVPAVNVKIQVNTD